MLKLPGLIDIHVHLRDMGQNEKEDFYTGTAAAVAGGFTTVIDMPNKLTPVFTEEVLDSVRETASAKAVCDIGFYFGSLGDNLDEFTAIQDKVMGIKLYMDFTTGGLVITDDAVAKVFAAWPGKTPILAHAEEGKIDIVADNVRKTGKKAHIVHITSKTELERVIKYKKEGLPITCGVCAHHLYLTQEDVSRLKGYGMMKPELKTPADRQFLWDNLDAIDVIESDHAPHTKAEKESNNPPFGVPGLETTLPLLLRAEKDGKITMEKIIDMAYTRPRAIFAIPEQPDTWVEVDETAEYEIDPATLQTKCGWTPFMGMKMRGRVTKVVLRNQTVFENCTVTAKAGSVRVLP